MLAFALLRIADPAPLEERSHRAFGVFKVIKPRVAARGRGRVWPKS
jgi:hypothetical protein